MIRLALAAFAMSIAGCASSPAIDDLRPGVADCATATGLGGLDVYLKQSWRAERFSFSDKGFTRSALSDDAWLKRASSNSANQNSLQSLQDAFPRLPARLPSGELLGFPAGTSPDGQRWAAALIHKKGDTSPKEIVVADGRSYERMTSAPGFAVSALAWSPDSERLALIEDTYKHDVKSFRDFVSPHPVPYSDVLLSVYRRTGQLVCQSMLSRDARYAIASIEWSRK
jgi:hypothetical protein